MTARVTALHSFYLKRLRVMTPREITHRVAEQLRTLQLRWRYRRGLAWSDVAVPDWQSVEFCRAARAQLPPLPWKLPSDDVQAELAEGRHAALGYAWNFFEENPWHRAPDTGREWPREFFGSIPFREGNPCGDARVVWEPARLQHLVALALIAERGEGEKSARAAALIERQFLSWMQDNPPLTGVHYLAAMECGLRLIAVCHVFDRVRGLLSQPERVWPAVLRLARSHAMLIEQRLSLYSSAGNHTVAEAAALIYAGTLFGEWSEAARWRERGLRLFRREVERQIRPDGGGVEQAFHYQRIVVDLCGLVDALLRARGTAPCPVVRAAFERGREFLARITPGAAALPPVGDSDSSYALSPYLDLAAPLAVAHATATSFEASGYLMIHHAARVPVHILFDHGDLGMSPACGHGHADALAVNLWVDGQELLLDPGTYGYTGHPPWRRYFRGTAAHNTVTVDGADQAVQEAPFLWSQNFHARRVKFERTGDGGVRVLAVHDGYARLGVRHWRALAYDPRGALLVWDRMEASGEHYFNLHWHCAREPGQEGAGLVIEESPLRVTMKCFGGEAHVVRAHIDPPLGWRAPMYGVRVPCATVRVTHAGKGAHEFVTCIEFGHGLDSAAVERITGELRRWLP